MKLIIVRHGIAVEHGAPGMKDEQRPLTEEGVEKFQEAARGLAEVLPRPDVLLTSPLVRARQTAEIAAAAWGKLQPMVEPRLAAGARPETILRAVYEHRGVALVAIFGHEPDCSSLLAHVLGTPHTERLAFKKGGAALVDLGQRPQDAGTLLWFAPPLLLRPLAH
jgi:phosphohistidine phosphatase